MKIAFSAQNRVLIERKGTLRECIALDIRSTRGVEVYYDSVGYSDDNVEVSIAGVNITKRFIDEYGLVREQLRYVLIDPTLDTIHQQVVALAYEDDLIKSAVGHVVPLY